VADASRRRVAASAVSRTRRGAPAAVSLALVVFLSACASGKPAAPTGSVRGVAVDDASGHGLPGITVTIQTGAGRVVDTVVTAPDGSYEFPSVPAGQYEIVTYFQGFKALAPLPVSVAAGSPSQPPPLRLIAPDSAPAAGP
jgi:carboxypeptidase family protein